MRIIRAFMALLALVHCAKAADITAAALTPAAVQYAINTASPGDRVLMPSGTATWTSGITITKSITLQGAGETATVINMEYPDPTYAYSTVISVDRVHDWRITGFTIHQGAANYSKMGIKAWCPTNFRIDHVRFEGLTVRGIYFGDQSGAPASGVIDHCFFQAPFNASAQAVTVKGTDTSEPPVINTAGNWYGAAVLGGSNAIFIEDCTFDFSYPNDEGIELYSGANVVARHNSFRNCGMGVHGRDSTSRSGCVYEFYQNAMTSDLGNIKVCIAQLRGGTGVYWGNTMTATGTQAAAINQILLSHYRATYNLIYRADYNDGHNPTDGNTPEPNGTGTHNGSNGAALLSDSTKNWTTDQWSHGGIAGTINRPDYIWNRTSGAGGWVTGNTATSVTATLTGGTRTTWSPGDTYVITTGYPGLDQIGRGGPTVLYGTFSTQAQMPLYQWGNTFNGSTVGAFKFVVQFTSGAYASVVPGAANFIKEGRDFYNDTMKPGYAAYTYPHPLISGEPPPPPPTVAPATNLRIIPTP